jgi:hypothetical protein
MHAEHTAIWKMGGRSLMLGCLVCWFVHLDLYTHVQAGPSPSTWAIKLVLHNVGVVINKCSACFMQPARALTWADHRPLGWLQVYHMVPYGSGSGMFYIRLRPSTAIGCGTKQ